MSTLRGDMRSYLNASLALSTRATYMYNSASRSFINFAITYHCLAPDGSLLPASEDTLMLYATFLATTLQPQSIKVYLFGIRNLHVEHGFPNPLTDALQLRRLLRGIKRLKGSHTDTRLPITPSLLRSFRPLLLLSCYDHLMLWAAMLVAFFGFLRSSELLALRRNDLRRTQRGYQLTVRVSKTDPFRQGATVTLTPSADNTLCAVSALEYLLAASNGRPGPLFQSREGVPLTRPRLNTLIRELVSHTGRPPQRYSSHSFRIGAASTAAAAGIPDWRIQALGRWSSDCYRRYIRLPDADSAQIAPTLARSTL